MILGFSIAMLVYQSVSHCKDDDFMDQLVFSSNLRLWALLTWYWPHSKAGWQIRIIPGRLLAISIVPKINQKKYRYSFEKLRAKGPENRWLGDNPFLLGYIFGCYLRCREGRMSSPNRPPGIHTIILDTPDMPSYKIPPPHLISSKILKNPISTYDTVPYMI